MAVVATIEGEKKLVKIDQSGDDTYIGFAKLGSVTNAAVWQLLKISDAGAVTTIAYADGNDNYDNVWDDRASKSYS